MARIASKAILYVLNSGNLYGTERMALATLAGMDEYDERVVFAPRPSGADSVALAARDAGFATVAFQTRWDFIRGVLPWFRPFGRLDIIATGVAQTFICHALARLLCVRLRQLQVSHGGTEDWHAYGKKKSLNRLPVRIVAVSDFVRGKLVDHGVRPQAISVIDNFLSEAALGDGLRRAPYDPARPGARPLGEPVRVAVVSRVDPIKRLDLLLDAVERHGLRDFQFDVYGAGRDLAALRARAAAFPHLRFHGFMAGVQARLIEADFVLHLCPEEPFGLVILEAFASGVVAIVPDAGGAGSIVDDGVTGFHFKASDIDSLAAVLDSARARPGAELQAMADAAAGTLQARFSQREGVQRYREAFGSPPR